jgi:hypothetical protein
MNEYDTLQTIENFLKLAFNPNYVLFREFNHTSNNLLSSNDFELYQQYLK